VDLMFPTAKETRAWLSDASGAVAELGRSSRLIASAKFRCQSDGCHARIEGLVFLSSDRDLVLGTDDAVIYLNEGEAELFEHLEKERRRGHHGGLGRHQGRRSKDGVVNTVPLQLTLPKALLNALEGIGKGNASMGLRAVLRCLESGTGAALSDLRDRMQSSRATGDVQRVRFRVHREGAEWIKSQARAKNLLPGAFLMESVGLGDRNGQ
jgi:hypothetical protein